ncbi:Protein FAR1-RELATED SEQUENCE 5 [Glycine max]|nr:Protein FAR1-RELATED SEQUENCE 5 [Glycine max]
MADTLGNIEIQEIESINVMPMDTPISFGEPCLGLEFESLEKVREFYNSFANRNGFGIWIRSSKPKMVVLVYCCEGQHKVKSLVDKDTHDNICQTSLTISRDGVASNWVIKSFSNDHNHVMLGPKSVCYMRCHKKMSVAAQSLVEKFEEEGLPTGKVASIFNNDVGDAKAVFNYCKRKQVENPNFFYAIQCDDDSRMVNFFWVDARSRVADQQFGDVITFDTSYKTNKYNESKNSFTWLFQTWLEAIGGKKLVSIITDQYLAIGAAIKKVFLETRHRLCLWHIRKKFPKKLAHVYRKRSTFKRELKRCIRESPCIDIFEEEWKHLMKEYNLLEGNEWLQGLYRIKES